MCGNRCLPEVEKEERKTDPALNGGGKMPRSRKLPRLDETKVDAKDMELLTQVESNVALSLEEQEALEGMRTHLNRYGKLTKSDRRLLKKLPHTKG